MIQLPKPLSPWGRALSIFPDEIARAVFDLGSRLSGVLGFSGEKGAQEGEPDGFAGIARRGSYEHLLLSEWLLQEEIPDEFIRRAASGEHAFFERSYKRDARAGRTVVLFDAGGDQLGSPRVVQLAALVLFAQRAEVQKSVLQWGTLQDESSTLYTGVTKGNIATFLHARTARRADSSDFERWRECARSSETSELWFVGSEHLIARAVTMGASLLALTESDALDAIDTNAANAATDAPQRVTARVHLPHVSRVREVTLKLPESRVAVQMLRDPFGSAHAPPRAAIAAIDTRSNIVVSVDGRQLWVRGNQGDLETLLTYRIPNSPNQRSKKSKKVCTSYAPPDGHRVVAVGRARSPKQTFVVTQSARQMMLHRLSSSGDTAVQSTELNAGDSYFLPPAANALSPLSIFDRSHAAFVDGYRKVVTVVGDKICAVAGMQYGEAFAPEVLGYRFVVALAYERCDQLILHCAMSVTTGRMLEIVASELKPELSGPAKTTPCFFSSVPGGGGVAVCIERNGEWQVHHQDPHALYIIRRGSNGAATAVGFGYRDASPARPYIVLIDETRKKLSLQDNNGSETIVTTPRAIAHAAVCPATRDVAYITEEGELGVYSCAHRAMVLRVLPASAQS